ncbi:glucose-6-phosphate isomerase [Brevundimonas sp. 2R-24]|uniref:Glucose-6-phosphate isomerase n=1 Tax=Peiella sedimenti TaxID=3061083 RepID=A0ABT8SLE5_9CAUL|nr:glucose-6-phosphate isomerase [Caulobacteraceae bacterium XZ-24]
MTRKPTDLFALRAAAQNDTAVRIVERFASEPARLKSMTVEATGLHIDLSRQPWSMTTLNLALDLAEARGVAQARAALFDGETVNRSEGRAVLHPALRAGEGAAYAAGGGPVSGEVEAMRARMRAFAQAVRSGEITGATGQRFEAVLHIGIGGSDLGPRLVWQALRPRGERPVELRFAANVDPEEFAEAIRGLDPASTLVVVVSKTFTTQETLANAELARGWLRDALGGDGDAHLCAVSAAPARAEAFGVRPDRVFAFWDWVGGRFSLWSAVGLSCAVALGWEAFEALLAGAEAMDRHFLEAPAGRNAPILMALAQVLNVNGLDRHARAVIPYAQRLELLPAFLQQLEMESNGKAVGADGQVLAHATCPVVFGEPGTNGQHAFFQLLHQGPQVIPVDFILVRRGSGEAASHHKLLANGVAQAEALLVGRDPAAVRAELADHAERDVLAPQKDFPGDRPSTVITLPELSPRALGALIALYEHKTFVEGVIWGLNSFDQWGVELGKALARGVLSELEGGQVQPHDPATAALIARLRT